MVVCGVLYSCKSSAVLSKKGNSAVLSKKREEYQYSRWGFYQKTRKEYWYSLEKYKSQGRSTSTLESTTI